MVGTTTLANILVTPVTHEDLPAGCLAGFLARAVLLLGAQPGTAVAQLGGEEGGQACHMGGQQVGGGSGSGGSSSSPRPRILLRRPLQLGSTRSVIRPVCR